MAYNLTYVIDYTKYALLLLAGGILLFIPNHILMKYKLVKKGTSPGLIKFIGASFLLAFITQLM